jgi:hypothetical protein
MAVNLSNVFNLWNQILKKIKEVQAKKLVDKPAPPIVKKEQIEEIKKEEKEQKKGQIAEIKDKEVEELEEAEEKEIEKEKGVIIEEINMREDLPQCKVQNLITELVYDEIFFCYLDNQKC